MPLAFMSQHLTASLCPIEKGSKWSSFSESVELGLAADELRTPWVFWQSHPSHQMSLTSTSDCFPLLQAHFLSPASQLKRFSSRGNWENALSGITTSG